MTTAASDCPGLAHRAGMFPTIADAVRSAHALVLAAVRLVDDAPGGTVSYADLGQLRELVGDLWVPGTCSSCWADALALVAVTAADLAPAGELAGTSARIERRMLGLARGG